MCMALFAMLSWHVFSRTDGNDRRHYLDGVVLGAEILTQYFPSLSRSWYPYDYNIQYCRRVLTSRDADN